MADFLLPRLRVQTFALSVSESSGQQRFQKAKSLCGLSSSNETLFSEIRFIISATQNIDKLTIWL